MALETHRRALRGGLPWIVVALVLLGVAVALTACVSPWLGEGAAAVWTGHASAAIGTFGSVAMLLGAVQVSRARTGGEASLAIVAFAPLWAVELGVRLWSLATAPDGETALALRVVAATAAMLAFSSGMAWLLARRGARRDAAAWRLARTAFLGLAVLVGVTLAAARLGPGDGGLWTVVESIPFGPALAWIAFVLPWLVLVRALRRSIHWVARGQTVAEVLAR